MYKKLRKAAADLGADAVIVSGQSQGFAGVPGVQSTVLAGNTAITTGGYYAFSYPKNQGIAIKYIGQALKGQLSLARRWPAQMRLTADSEIPNR